MMKQIFSIIFPLFLSGCAPLAIGGIIGTIGFITYQEGGLGQLYEENKLEMNIQDQLVTKSIAQGVSLTIQNGHVLAVGTVATPEKHIEVIKTIWNMPGVKEVHDEIKVKTQHSSTLMNQTSDAFITAKVRSSLMTVKGINPSHYTITTSAGEVFVMGNSPSQIEEEKVLIHIRKINGVKKVVSYVKVGTKY